MAGPAGPARQPCLPLPVSCADGAAESAGPGAGAGTEGGGCLVSSAGTRRPIASAAGVNRAAGQAMVSDWCGRQVL